MTVPRLIDSHCHLDFEVFDNDRREVLQRASDNNISDIIIPGTERIYWNRITMLCESNARLHACYGIHPYRVERHSTQDIEALEKYIEKHPPVALGECGLDYRTNQADRKLQMFFFEAQLAMAARHNLPVVVHSVKATEVVIQTIKKFNGLCGMIHSYSGSYEQAKQLIALNFYISFSASITHEKASKITAVARDIPLTSVLLETDAPDQPDASHANGRNEPAYLIHTLDALSIIRHESKQRIIEQTEFNAKKLFKIE